MKNPQISDIDAQRTSMDLMKKQGISGSIVKPNNPLLLSSEDAERYTPLTVAYSIASQPYQRSMRDRQMDQQIELVSQGEDRFNKQDARDY